VKVEGSTLRPIVDVSVALEHGCGNAVNVEDVRQRQAAWSTTYDGDARTVRHDFRSMISIGTY
jgi:hypothetical protein